MRLVPASEQQDGLQHFAAGLRAAVDMQGGSARLPIDKLA
jgi:hypothetical protein